MWTALSFKADCKVCIPNSNMEQIERRKGTTTIVRSNIAALCVFPLGLHFAVVDHLVNRSGINDAFSTPKQQSCQVWVGWRHDIVKILFHFYSLLCRKNDNDGTMGNTYIEGLDKCADQTSCHYWPTYSRIDQRYIASLVRTVLAMQNRTEK